MGSGARSPRRLRPRADPAPPPSVITLARMNSNKRARDRRHAGRRIGVGGRADVAEALDDAFGPVNVELPGRIDLLRPAGARANFSAIQRGGMPASLAKPSRLATKRAWRPPRSAGGVGIEIHHMASPCSGSGRRSRCRPRPSARRPLPSSMQRTSPDRERETGRAIAPASSHSAAVEVTASLRISTGNRLRGLIGT